LRNALSIIGVRALTLLLLLFHLSCWPNPEQKPENAYEEFSAVLVRADEEECRGAQEKYLALLDEEIKGKTIERDALIAQLRGSGEQAQLLQIAILDLEKELSKLSLQRQKIGDTRCDEGRSR
jgi:hypothetical protein